jgi:ABC-2 type transport system ATP-binding protein
VLQAESLTKVFDDGKKALDALDLTVEQRELFCLLGPNGAGKSTTIHLFLNFLTPTSGRALVDGIDCTQEPHLARQRIAYIPENVSLYPRLSGRENLEYFHAIATGQRSSKTQQLQWLEQAGLERAAADKRVQDYSKGMKQKVGIAIAIAKNAEVLLLDEPTSGLDPLAANEFAKQIRILRDRGMAILMVTHDLFLAQQCATRIGVMRAGKLMTTLRPSQVDLAGLEAAYLQALQVA